MGKYKKLFSNTLAMGIGQFSSKVLSFLLVPLYTSVLSTEEFGTYDLIITTVTMLTPFLTLVVSEAVMRYCMDKKYNSDEVLSVGIIISCLGTVILALFYPLLCKIESLNSEYVQWLIVFFLVTNLHTVLTQYLKGIEKVVFFSICGVISTVLSLVMCILFLLRFEWGIRGYFLATSLSHTLVCVIIFLKEKLYKKLRNPFKISMETVKEMLKFSVPMMPNSISWWVSNSSSKYILLYYATASAVGIYSVAYKIPSVLSIVITIFISAFQISIFENFNKDESKNFFKEIYSGFSAVNIVVASFLILTSKYIASILYQNEFFEAWKVSCIIVFAYIFHSLSALLGTLYSAAKKTKFLFISTCLGALINIVLSFLLIPKFGCEGAGLALLVSYICVWLSRVVNIKKQFGYSFSHLKNLLSFILIGIQVFLSYTDTAVAVCISAALFAVLCVLNIGEILKMQIVKGFLKTLTGKLKKIKR